MLEVGMPLAMITRPHVLDGILEDAWSVIPLPQDLIGQGIPSDMAIVDPLVDLLKGKVHF